jgi:6-phosphogluconolactonase
MKKISIYPSQAEMIRSAASHFISTGMDAIHKRGSFSVALSGGSTPEPLYQVLAGPEGDLLDWEKVHFFWGDERPVLHDHPDSNFSQANKFLLQPRSINTKNVHSVQTELPAPEAARKYQEEILTFFHGKDPRFDLILLGMGNDGHTASLFPGSKLVSNDLPSDDCLVSANWVSKLNSWRITFTHHLINAAHHVSILVSGQGKAKILKSVLEGPSNPAALPSQLINPEQGELIWFIDQEAASKLSKDT